MKATKLNKIRWKAVDGHTELERWWPYLEVVLSNQILKSLSKALERLEQIEKETVTKGEA